MTQKILLQLEMDDAKLDETQAKLDELQAKADKLVDTLKLLKSLVEPIQPLPKAVEMNCASKGEIEHA